MKRKEIIRYIKQTYPADSKEDDTRAIGKRLLTEVLEENKYLLVPFLSNNWKLLPDNFLLRYYWKCKDLQERR